MTKVISSPDYLTPSEVAKLLFVSPVTVRQWSQKGWLKSEYTAGGHRRFLPDEVNRFVKQKGLKLHYKTSSEQRIMIIDDDKQLVSYLRELLDGESGVGAVEFSHGGFEAGMKVRDFKPDVILLDLMMPQLDGFAVCRLLKSDPLTAGIRVIAMTGYQTKENENKIMAEGAEICISKPFDKEHLFKILGIGQYINREEINF